MSSTTPSQDIAFSASESSGTGERTRSETRSRLSLSSRGGWLGLAFLGPALVMLALFFLAPAVLTGVFAFTNMSTSTGISGGAYVITGNLVRDLEERGLPKSITEPLARESYVVNDTTLAAAANAKFDRHFLEDISSDLNGKSFKDRRDFERALKKLRHRPRSIRELKLAADPFSQSILNQRFESRDQARSAIAGAIGSSADAATVNEILAASYTGWTWTTENFSHLMASPDTWRVLGNTLFYVATTLCFTTFVGLFLAVTTFYLPKSSATLFSVLWLLPRITPLVLYAIMWKWFTWEGGFVYTLAKELGLPAFNYMKGSVPSAWTVVILINGFIGASFAMILFSGALKAIPQQQLWASEVDGASRWQQIRYIILPQLRWPILFVTSYQTLSLLSSYEQIWLTTDGGPGSTTTVWSLEAFKTALNNYTGNLQYGLGAAMALALVFVGLGLAILYLRLFRFDSLVERPKIEF